MIAWLTAPFREQAKFRFPKSQPLPRCRVRPAKERDFAACEEIYRLNEPGRFPAGYFNHFSKWLRLRRDLFVVAEAGGRILACGGLNVDTRAVADAAALNFGMVHPEHHRQGFGTALLLARLATLAQPDVRWLISISTTGGSETFYRRFGFRRLGRFAGRHGEQFVHYYVTLYRNQWQACRALLECATIVLDTEGAAIPELTEKSDREWANLENEDANELPKGQTDARRPS